MLVSRALEALFLIGPGTLDDDPTDYDQAGYAQWNNDTNETTACSSLQYVAVF